MIFLFLFLTATELDAVKGIFAEKEKELQAAVSKVEELSTQLEELKKGNMNGLSNGGGYVYQSPASMQLDKLRQELLVSVNTNHKACPNIRKFVKNVTILEYQDYIWIIKCIQCLVFFVK